MQNHHITFVANRCCFFLSHRAPIAREFIARGGRAVLLAPQATPVESRQIYGLQLAFQALPFNWRRVRLMDLLRTSLFMWRYSREHRETTWFLIAIIPVLFCGIPLRLRGRPMIIALSGMGSAFSSTSWKFRLIRPLIRRIYRWMFNAPGSRVIVQNTQDLETLARDLRINRRHIFLVEGSGVDEEAFPFTPLPPMEPAPRILVPARLIHEKGIREACQASRLLSEGGVPHEMIFAGQPDPGNPHSFTAEDIATLAADHPCTRFIGQVDDMASLLQTCHVVCLPSYREGLPRALIEAFAAGRAVVTCDTTGCAHLVRHNRNGLLVPVRDGPALAAALQRLLTDEVLRLRLIQQAREEFLQTYTLEQVVDKILKICAASERERLQEETAPDKAV